MVFDADGQVPFKVEDAQLHVRWGLMPPLGKVPWMVQDVHNDVKFDDVLLEVGSLLKMFGKLSLLDDVDKIDGLIDVSMLDSPTVLDEQGDVEAN